MAPDPRKTRSALDPLPYYKWLVIDFRASRRVKKLDYIQRGLLRDLLDEQWIEGALRDDVDYLADVCECPVGVMAEAWKVLKQFFPPLDGMDGLYLANRKLESVRSREDAIRAQRKLAGAKGGLAKASKATQDKDLVASASTRQQVPYSSAEQSKAGAGRPVGSCGKCGGRGGIHAAGCELAE